MRSRLSFVLSSVVFTACLEAPVLRRAPPPLRLVSLESPTGDLDRTARLVALRIRFDRAVAWPSPDAVILVRGRSSESLRRDAEDGVLSTANAARRVPVRLARDPREPTTLTVEALAPELPDAPLTLLVTSMVRAEDGGRLSLPNAGPRGAMFSLTVAPARRCGAIGRVEGVAPGDTPLRLARVFVRFDRAVRGARAEQPLVLLTETGAVLPSRAALDCFDDDGHARCAELSPSTALAPRTVYRVFPAPSLRARNAVPVEGVLGTVTTGDRLDAPRVAFGAPLVCAAGEQSLAGFCVRGRDRSIELRAATTEFAVLRVTATALEHPAPARRALSATGTIHGVRLQGLIPATVWHLTVEAVGADGRSHDTRSVVARTSAARPRVRVSEVLARPRSTSAQEYVELVNDEAYDVDLSNWSIAQGTASSLLPPRSILRARGRAAVVGANFDPRGDARTGDPPLAPGATLFTTRTAVSGRGLRDDGADLTLLDPEGGVVARVPSGDPARPPREGVGLVRADTDLEEDDIAAWTYDAEGSCTPGAEDRIR